MGIYALAFLLASVLTFTPLLASAEMTVVGVALAQDIQDRQPLSEFEPTAYCEMDTEARETMPLVDSSVANRIFFWTKVQSGETGMLRHTWYLNTGTGWQQATEVDLNIVMSPGYRTWSSKRIDPSMHTSEWMIKVTLADDTGRVLCTTKFRVT